MRSSRMGVIVTGVTGALTVAGCGLPSTTLALKMAARGTLPAGVTSARFTVAQMDVAVTTKDHGEVWVELLDTYEGDRTFDLAQLTQQTVLASDRDVPEGAIQEVDVVFQSEPGGLSLAPGAPTTLKFPVGGLKTNAVSLVIDFDVDSSLKAAPGGGYQFSPVAQLEESP